MMRAYELMVIIDGDLEDTAAQARVKSITDSINKKEYGYYVVYQLLAPGAALDDLERSFRIADDIVRHKLIRLPDSEAERRGLSEPAA